LSESRDSLVAMLEAFLYDPLISWRLVDLSRNDEDASSLSVVNTVNCSGLQPDSRVDQDNSTIYTDTGVPIDICKRTEVLPISEGDEDDDGDGENIDLLVSEGLREQTV
jgi:hypothetical protein